MTAEQTMIDVIIDKIREDLHGFHEDDIITACMKEYARIKCLEAIKNTRHKAVDVLLANDYYALCKDHMYEIEKDHTLPENEIQNISNQDVMPEL